MYNNYEVMKLQTWIDMFDPDEINLDKLEEYLSFIKEAMKNYDSTRYSEWHHVMPRCIDVNHTYDNEGAQINGSDHFRAHMKLVECFNGVKRRKLSYALMRMCSSKFKEENITPEDYEESKRLHSESMKGQNHPLYGKTGKLHPLYGKHLSEEAKQRISSIHTGKHLSEETRHLISIKTKGSNNPFYNKHHSEETKAHLSEVLSGENHPFYGKKHSEESKKKMSLVHQGEKNSMFGKHHTEESRKKMSDSHKGEKNHMYGKEHSEEARDKIRKANSNKRCITNGIDNIMIPKDDPVPDGWRYGKTMKRGNKS